MPQFKLRLFALLLLSGGIFLFPNFGLAKTIYIDFSASTNGSGTESSPYNSAAGFNSNFAAGDTVYFGGTYTGNDFGINDKDATAATPTVFSQWTGKTTATFAGTGSAGFSAVNSDYVQIIGMSMSSTGAAGLFINGGSNITITNSTATSTAGAAIQINGATNVTITGATAQNALGGIATAGTVTGLTITGCTITGANNGTNGHGISLQTSSDVSITNNTISSNSGSGIHMSGITTITTLTVTGNTVHSNSVNGLNLASSGITGLTVSGNKIYNHTSTTQSQGLGISISTPSSTVSNNLIFGNRTGLFFNGGAPSTTGTSILNNTFYNNTSSAIAFRESGNGVLTNFTIENNTVTTATDANVYAYVEGDGPTWTSLDYNNYLPVGSNAKMLSNTVSTLTQWQTSTSGDAHALSADPLFTSTTSGSEDFTLQATSTLIEAGKPTSSAPTTDYAANARPWTGGTGGSGRYDIGAYEKQNLVSSTNVALAGTASYDSTSGHTVALTITDATNTSAYYAITTDGTNWLNGSGSLTTTPTYLTSKSWTHQSLATNTAYAYQLRIAYGSGATSYLPLLTAVSVTTSPDQVTGVTAVAQKDDKALITWTAVTGASSYDVSYGRAETADDTAVTGVTTTQKQLTDLVAGKHYFVKVRAANTGGAKGAWSSVVHVETMFPTLGIALSQSNGLSNRVYFHSIKGKEVKSFDAFPKGQKAMMVVRSLDVDGDGDVEIAIGRFDEAGGSQIRLFDHLGKLIDSTNVFEKGIKNGISMDVGDFDFDGTDELAVIPFKGASELRIYDYDVAKKKFTKTSVKQVFPPSQKGGARVFTADLNGDYKDDLIVTQPGRKSLESYTLDATSKLQTIADLTIPIVGSQLATGDADGDGDDEVVIVADRAKTDSLVRLYGLNDKGKFELLVTTRPYPTKVKGFFRVRTGDVNGDGKDELIVIPGMGNPGDLRVLAYDPSAQKVNKRFVTMDGERVGTNDELQGKHVGVMDLDQSGKAEIIVASMEDEPTVWIYSLNAKEKLTLVKKFNPVKKAKDTGWDIGL